MAAMNDILTLLWYDLIHNETQNAINSTLLLKSLLEI